MNYFVMGNNDVELKAIRGIAKNDYRDLVILIFQRRYLPVYPCLLFSIVRSKVKGKEMYFTSKELSQNERIVTSKLEEGTIKLALSLKQVMLAGDHSGCMLVCSFIYAPCIEICPTSALYKDRIRGWIKLEGKRCINCHLCQAICPANYYRTGL